MFVLHRSEENSCGEYSSGVSSIYSNKEKAFNKIVQNIITDVANANGEEELEMKIYNKEELEKRLCYMDVGFNGMHVLCISKEYDNENTMKNVELMLSKEFFSYEKYKDFYIVYTYKKGVHQTSQDQ